MNIHDACEQAYKNGYEAGLAEREETVCQLRKKWQAAEMHICTKCGHFDHKTDGNIVYGNKSCGEIVGYPVCGKFTPWIPVTERLPEKNVEVLVYNGKYFEVAEYYTHHIGSISFDKWSVPQYWGIPTHWMPLPEPPKGE